MDLSFFQEWRVNKELPLVGLFCGHLLFSAWSLLGKWSGNKLILQDTFLLICLLWSLHNRKRSSPVLLSMLIEMMSILMDIIILAIYYPSGELWSSTEKFSAVMAIFNLTLRFGAILVLYQNYQDRLSRDGNNWGNNVGGIYVGGNNNKGAESIYGKTVGPHNNGPSQPIAVSMVGGGSIYSTNQQNKVTSGSVLSHPGSNLSTSGYGYNQQPYQHPRPDQQLPPIPPSYSQHA